MATTARKTPWDTAGISKATYYRKKKAGEPLTKEERHKNLIDSWVSWRESGLTVRPWARTHKTLQLHYIGKYFVKYRTVSAANLEAWLAQVPAESYSKRKHIHSAVSSFAKYLRLICPPNRGPFETRDFLSFGIDRPPKVDPVKTRDWDDSTSGLIAA